MEVMEYLRFAMALVFVLGLIGACSWFGKRMGLAPRIGGGGPHQRLSVIEIQAIDAKRKLVLIRRDDVEHLIMLNADHDLLIEAGIAAAPAAQVNAAPAPHGLQGLSRILPFSGKFTRG